jgi:hypothetical protein
VRLGTDCVICMKLLFTIKCGSEIEVYNEEINELEVSLSTEAVVKETSSTENGSKI